MPAVVLNDVKPPGMTGAEWLKEIRAADAELPVILVAGQTFSASFTFTRRLRALGTRLHRA